MLECLAGIIGVTTSECECIIQGLTPEQRAEMAVSTSGLFLDNLPGGVHVKSIKYVDACKSMYDMTKNAIATAKQVMESDLIVALNSRYTTSKKTYNGNIGRMSYAQSLAVVKPWQGIKLKPREYSDSVVTIQRMHIAVNEAADLTIKIFRVYVNSVMGEEIHALPVTTVANGYALVTLPTNGISLPLVYNNEPVEYWVLYDLSANPTVLPKDTNFACGSCNGGVSGYSEFLTAQGVQVDDTALLNQAKLDNYSRGLILEVKITCESSKLFCREYSATEAVAVVMSYSTWYKAGELLIEDVMKTPDVNRYTTMAKEYLWGKRNHFRAEYESRLNYLASSLNVTDSNCYVCNQTTNQPYFGAILA